MASLASVNWAADSASGLECATDLTRLVLAGELVAEVRANPSLGVRNVARVADWALETFLGPQPIGDAAAELSAHQIALLELAAAMGITLPATGPLSWVQVAIVVMQLLRSLQDILDDTTVDGQ